MKLLKRSSKKHSNGKDVAGVTNNSTGINLQNFEIMIYTFGMIYRLFSFLFRSDVFDTRYTPRPWHLIYALLLLGAGSVTFGQGWYAFGVFTFLFGIALGGTIILGMNWDKAIEYWSKIDDILVDAAKIKDPVMRADILKSMGYNATPETVKIIEVNEGSNEEGWSMKYNHLPISSSVLQVVADKVLMSGKADFTEEVYGDIVPNFRKTRKQMKQKGWLTPKNKKNVRLGYAFTAKGIKEIYEFASEGVKLDLKRTKKEGDYEK